MQTKQPSSRLLTTFVTPASWLQSVHPVITEAAAAFACLASHCATVKDFDDYEDLAHRDDIQAVQYCTMRGRPATHYKKAYLALLWDNLERMRDGLFDLSVEEILVMLHSVLADMPVMDAIQNQSIPMFLSSRVPRAEWQTWGIRAEVMFGILFELDAHMIGTDKATVPVIDRNGLYRTDCHVYWPGWLLGFAFELEKRARAEEAAP
ncbi:hypothetical protein RY831_29460 [Noviherbaspirillum sp. CPCC 100848]|uniref:Uncharacterized protein n=1 Tax=Noviherbaspirillum album TaxID=3080276 RepID=A0ABU6JI06_9BURK|nr:hypothetical protein [Noviherbaspirillum sp. CPCC 100848]MEC4723289.1 hypothetical protein [Noviherbaspirillum sp. CPCC 100848]